MLARRAYGNSLGGWSPGAPGQPQMPPFMQPGSPAGGPAPIPNQLDPRVFGGSVMPRRDQVFPGGQLGPPQAGGGAMLAAQGPQGGFGGDMRPPPPGARVLPGPQQGGDPFGGALARLGPGMATPSAPPNTGTPYDYSQSAYGPPPGYGGQQRPFIPPGYDRPAQDPLVDQNERDNFRRRQDRIAQGRLAPGDPGYGDRERAERRAAMDQSTQQYREYLAREREQNAGYLEWQRQQALQPQYNPAPVPVGRSLSPMGRQQPSVRPQSPLPSFARQSPITRY